MKTLQFSLLIITILFLLEVTSMETKSSIIFPRPTGHYAVGTTAKHLIDKNRTNEFFGVPNTPRELIIQIWYPTTTHKAEITTTPYSPDAIHYWKSKIKTTDTQQLSSLDSIHTYAKKDAPLAFALAPYPVLIFSPGFAQMRTANTALCEHIASHEYIVVSIDYTYLSEYVSFPDGRNIVGQNIVFTGKKEQELQDLLVEDIDFVISSLHQLNNNANSMFHNKLDLNNIGIFGHSIGGSSALFATKRLKQIKAGINIDGGILGDHHLLQNFDKPFMHILAEESVTWSEMLKNLSAEQLLQYGFANLEEYKKRCDGNNFLNNELHKQQTSDVYKVVIKGAGHMSFGDAIFLQENELLLPFLYLQFGKGTLPGKIILNLTTSCIVTFFDKCLKDNKNHTIEKKLSENSEIEIIEMA